MEIVNDNRFMRTSVDNQLFSHSKNLRIGLEKKRSKVGDPDQASKN
jgi:hypothetical protein